VNFSFPIRRLIAIAGITAAALTLAGSAVSQVSQIRTSQAGELHALIIGVDDYQFMPRLKGAVADGRDIESTLRSNGVTDVTALYDAAPDRETVMRSLDELLARSRAGDLVILSIAGHGSQEPERVKGSQPDGMDNVFILAGFNPKTAAGAQQRILGSEFNHVIKQFEAKGVRMLFVADACHGGGLARDVDPRAAEMSYRQAPPYTLAADDLKPISTARDAFLSEIDFQQTTFVAAVDRNTKAPEIRIPGIAGFRGALSYAVARALDGAADENRDGQTTQGELFSYVQQVAYQLSDQRQLVVTSGPAVPGVNSEVLYSRTRAVVMLDAPERSEARPQASQSAVTTPTGLAASRPPAAPPPPPKVVRPLDTVRLAVLSNQRELLKGVEAREARFEAVATTENPDLVWDPTTLDVLAGADIVARGINQSDLSSVIDRAAAVNGFKRLSAAAPQTVRVLPDDNIHRRASRLDVQVSGVSQRSLLLFNIAGDGTVQSLYPIGSDPTVIPTADYKFPVLVGEPFGSDQVVAITSSQRLGDLEQALKKMSQKRASVEVYKLVERYAPSDARIGVTNLYTSP
jgi:hypothetical protein